VAGNWSNSLEVVLMDIRTLEKVVTKLPANIAVLLRGPTGVGKSFIGKAVAEKLGVPFLDVRLSVMSEGDVGGYPDIEGMKESGVMTMCMPAWFVRATREPVVLMLDELNRALPGVQQSAFQLVLDRELGNDVNGMPYRLHPDTRIIAAVNHGAEYDVNNMDPALLRRFWVSDVSPTTEDWISYANANGMDSVLVDFVRQNPAHLRVDMSKAEPGSVVPTPASWHRLNDALVHMGFAPSELAGSTAPEGFYAVCTGFVGTEASIALTSFVQDYQRVLTAEDVLDRFADKKADLKGIKASEVASLTEKLVRNAKENNWTPAQVANFKAFTESLGGEQLISLWNALSTCGNLKNVQACHPFMAPRIVAVVQAARAAEINKKK
jgi:hypothetical protein